MNGNEFSTTTKRQSKDERILWTGRPRSGVLFRPRDAVLIPVSVILCAASSVTVSSEAPLERIVPLAILVSLGLYLAVGRFWVDAKRREKLTYTLTNQRVLISYGSNPSATKIMKLVDLREVTFERHSHSFGTISFTKMRVDQILWDRYWPFISRYSAFEFEWIAEVERVYGLVLAARNDAALKQ